MPGSSFPDITPLSGDTLWKPGGLLYVPSDLVDTLPLSRVHAFLFTTPLYTIFGMESGSSRCRLAVHLEINAVVTAINDFVCSVDLLNGDVVLGGNGDFDGSHFWFSFSFYEFGYVPLSTINNTI